MRLRDFRVMFRVMSVPNRSTFCIGYSRFFTVRDIEKARIYAVFDANTRFLKKLMTGIGLVNKCRKTA